MSERKTAEIKLRVSPSDKARWQARADEAKVSLSALICCEMNAQAHSAEAAKHLDGTVLLNNAIVTIADDANVRRSDVCEHGKATFVFCRDCDA